MRALVFDLDGTIVDTKDDMLDAGNCKHLFKVGEQYYAMDCEKRV